RHQARIVSAHRTPKRMFAFAEGALADGIKVIIAGAGGAAHLPGMIASLTTLPVLGVPVESRALKGLDSLLSIAQMPGGVPVGTLGRQGGRPKRRPPRGFDPRTRGSRARQAARRLARQADEVRGQEAGLSHAALP